MMVNILAFNGSPRKKGNTSLLLKELIRGARESSATIEEKKVQSSSPLPQEVQPLKMKAEDAESSSGGWGMFFWGFGAGLLVSSLLAIFFLRKRPKRYLRNY